MRIGIDARFFGGEQSKGLGRYTQKLIEHSVLQDQKHEYVVFIQEESAQYFENVPENIEVVIAPFRWYTFAEQIHMPRLIRKARVDLMHFPHFNVPLLYNGPFVVTIHDLIILRFPTERASTLSPLLYAIKHWAGKRVMHHAVKKAKHIITVSEFSKDDIVEYFDIREDQVTVTYEAAEQHHIAADTPGDSVIKKYGITGPYVLYVGNAYPHKNLEVLIEVAYRMKEAGRAPEYQFVLVGKKDYFYNSVEELVQEKGLQDYFHFPGFVADEDLPHMYTQADVYIFPSLYEGFGLPPLEAMQYQVPVLAARTSCLPEILGNAAQYFDSADISGIIKSIDEIRTNTELQQELVNKGNAQVQKYSWEKMAEQTMNVYTCYGKKNKT